MFIVVICLTWHQSYLHKERHQHVHVIKMPSSQDATLKNVILFYSRNGQLAVKLNSPDCFPLVPVFLFITWGTAILLSVKWRE